MQTGWQKVGSTWYYFKSSGVMLTGWQKVGSTWYYFKSSGAMATGWQQVGAAWYYFNGSGAMVTGWQKSDNAWYYFASSGAMQTGWLQLSGKWYYFEASGAMVTGTKTINGKTYTFDSNGVMQETEGVVDLYDYLGQPLKPLAEQYGFQKDENEWPSNDNGTLIWSMHKPRVYIQAHGATYDAAIIYEIDVNGDCGFTVMGITDGMPKAQVEAILKNRGWTLQEGSDDTNSTYAKGEFVYFNCDWENGKSQGSFWAITAGMRIRVCF